MQNGPQGQHTENLEGNPNSLSSSADNILRTVQHTREPCYFFNSKTEYLKIFSNTTARKKKTMKININGESLTCLWVYREVRLPMQNAVHHTSTVSIGGVISICCCHLEY